MINMANYAGSATLGYSGYSRWRALNPELHTQIAEFFFCYAGLPEVAKRAVIQRTNLSRMYYEYGTADSVISWKSTVAPAVDAVIGTTQSKNTQDPHIIRMVRKAMIKAYDYYLMYGMCPAYIESVRNVRTGQKQYVISVPMPNSGHFIARTTPTNNIEVGWKWNNNHNISSFYKTEPDDAVYVHIWDLTTPWLEGLCPFRSVIPKLISDWRRRCDTWGRHEKGEINSVNPRLIVQGKTQGNTLERMQPSEMYNDMLHGGDLERSAHHQSSARIDRSFQKRVDDALTASIRNTSSLHGGITGSDGHHTVEDVNAGDDLRVVYMPSGTSTGTYPLPKTSGLVPGIDDWWASRVSAMMRVPIDILTGKKSPSRSTKEAEISSDMMDVSVREARDVMTNFIERTWSVLFGDMENTIIEMEESSLAEKENLERATIVDYLRHLLSVDANHPDLPTGTTTQRLNEIQSEKTEGREEGDEIAKIEVNDGDSGRAKNEVATELEKIAFSEMERLRKVDVLTEMIHKNAANVGIGLDSASLRQEVTKVVYFIETGKYNAEMQRKRIDDLKNEKKKFKVGFFSQASVSSERIAEFVKDGTISEEAGHILRLMKHNLPLDTPRGELEAIRLMKAKMKLTIEQERAKSEIQAKQIAQKAKLDQRLLDKGGSFDRLAPESLGTGDVEMEESIGKIQKGDKNERSEKGNKERNLRTKGRKIRKRPGMDSENIEKIQLKKKKRGKIVSGKEQRI
jgi:hypothetical protein